MPVTTSTVSPPENAILRKIIYPGLAVVLCIPIEVAISYYDRYLYRATFWQVDVEGLIASALLVLAICLGFAIATRDLKRILLAIPSAIVVGILSYKAGKVFMSILFPSEYEVALGAIGQFIERHCSVTFGCNIGDLVASFLAKLAISVIIASSATSLLLFLGGTAGGFVFSVLAFMSGFFGNSGITVDGPFQLALAVLWTVPLAFTWGATLSGSILLGQILAPRLLCRNPRTLSSRADG